MGSSAKVPAAVSSMKTRMKQRSPGKRLNYLESDDRYSALRSIVYFSCACFHIKGIPEINLHDLGVWSLKCHKINISRDLLPSGSSNGFDKLSWGW